MPSEYGKGFAFAGEGYYLRGPRAAWWDRLAPVPLCLYAHGATGTTGTVTDNNDEMRLINALARKFLVVVSEWGGDQYLNDTHISRLEAGRVAAQTLNVDPSGRTGLVGMSMGAGGSLAYARAFPGKVNFVAGLIPALDLNDLAVNNRLGLAAALNAAYPPTGYDDAVHGPTHSPVKFAANLPGNLPIRLWTSSNDAAAVPSTAAAFIAARPQTTRTDLGAVGHSTASITAAVADIAAWVIAQAE